MKKIVFIFILSVASYHLFAGDVTPPENIVVISHFFDPSNNKIQMSVIDLDNNELVILLFNNTGKITRVTRTGMTIDIEKQMKILNS